MIALSDGTRQRIAALFSADDVHEAERLLREECAGNVHFPIGTPEGLERVRFAALRTSRGELARLRDALRLAQVDWRDLLVEAGFANDPTAHERWSP